MSVGRIYLGFKDNKRNKAVFLLQDARSKAIINVLLYDYDLLTFHSLKYRCSYIEPLKLLILLEQNKWGYSSIAHNYKEKITSYAHLENHKTTINLPVTLDQKSRDELLKLYEKSLGPSRFTPAMWKAKADLALQTTAELKKRNKVVFYEGVPVTEIVKPSADTSILAKGARKS